MKMSKTVVFALVLSLAFAGSASAALLSNSSVTYTEKTFTTAEHYDVDTSRDGPWEPISLAGPPNVQSWDLEGAIPPNIVMVVDVADLFSFPSGTPMTINGIGWDLNITTVGLSWLSEATISYSDGVAPPGLFLRPGAGNDVAGSMDFSSGGIVKLDGAGIPDVVLPTGMLTLEFFESWDDVAGAVDADYLADAFGLNRLTIQIPEPATLALLAMGGIALIRRRR